MGRLLERSMELVPADSNQAGALLATYGKFLGLERGDYKGAQQAFGRALSIARRELNLPLEIRTLANAADVDYFHHEYEKGLKRAHEAIEVLAGIDDPHAEVALRWRASRFLRGMGDFERIGPHTAAMLVLAERLRDRYWLATALSTNVLYAMEQGDWQAARSFSERSLTASPMDARVLSNRVRLEYLVGEFDRGEHFLGRLLEVMRGTTPGPRLEYAYPAVLIPLIARISDLPNRYDIAEEAAAVVLSSPSVTPLYAQSANIGLALLAVLRGDEARAAEQYAKLEDRRGQLLPGGAAIAADRVLGLLALTMGNLDQATEHFEEALAFCRKAGWAPELSWSCCDYAETLLLRGNPADQARAVSLLDEARCISEELGMRPLMERVAVFQEGSRSLPLKAPTYPDGLTLREVEVLRLIASGMTDREIADELFISARTVGYHVGNILNKTNSANRAEAATYAARQELL
ncbi:MAG: LuxR C-terminal-related transcriptional regulator [Dehalococcoidia bacterium]